MYDCRENPCTMNSGIVDWREALWLCLISSQYCYEKESYHRKSPTRDQDLNSICAEPEYRLQWRCAEVITTAPQPKIETVKLHEIRKRILDDHGQKEMHCGILIVKKFCWFPCFFTTSFAWIGIGLECFISCWQNRRKKTQWMHNTSSSSYQSICLIKVNVKNNNNK